MLFFNCCCSLGYQANSDQNLLDYLYDICHGRALLSSLAINSNHRSTTTPTHHSTPPQQRKRVPSSLLTPEDLAHIRQSMDGYTSASLSPSTSHRNTITSRRSQSSSGVSLPPMDYGERLTSIDVATENLPTSHLPQTFTIEDISTPFSNSQTDNKDETDLEEIPVPYGPIVVRCVPLVLPSARVTLIRRCVSAFRNVSFLFSLILFCCSLF